MTSKAHRRHRLILARTYAYMLDSETLFDSTICDCVTFGMPFGCLCGTGQDGDPFTVPGDPFAMAGDSADTDCDICLAGMVPCIATRNGYVCVNCL